jgi:hypothetical protein
MKPMHFPSLPTPAPHLRGLSLLDGDRSIHR